MANIGLYSNLEGIIKHPLISAKALFQNNLPVFINKEWESKDFLKMLDPAWGRKILKSTEAKKLPLILMRGNENAI